MSLENGNINLDSINPDWNLSLDEKGIIEKLSNLNNYSLENLSSEIDNNSKLKQLINRDYATINQNIGYQIKLEDVQKKLIELGFDIGNFGKNNDGVDGKFGKFTFLAIIKLQKSLGLKVNGIISLDLLSYVFPDKFVTRNKTKDTYLGDNPKAVKDLLKEKLELYNNKEQKKQEIQRENKQDITIIADEVSGENQSALENQNIGQDLLVKNNNFIKEDNNKQLQENDIIITNDKINFQGVGKIRNKNGMTLCAGINRQTLEANGIKGFWYEAEGKYSYIRNILNPNTRDSNIFINEKLVTQPKKIILSSEFLNNNSKGKYLRSREGGFIKQELVSDFSNLNDLENGDIITLVFESNTKRGGEYGHMSTGMKLNGKIYIVDPVLLADSREPIEYNNYLREVNQKNTLKIKGVLVYDKSNNTNETYLASIKQKSKKIASSNDNGNSGKS